MRPPKDACASHGGVRPCPYEEVPAPPATILLTSPTPTSLVIEWTEGEYLNPFTAQQSSCRFKEWIVSMRRAGLTEWTRLAACGTEIFNRDRREPCEITGLGSVNTYEVQVEHICFDSPELLNSDPAVASLRTPPVAAEAPRALTAAPAEGEMLNLSWTPGAPGDCEFVEWWVEWRTFGGNSTGEWTNASECGGGGDRNASSCVIEGFLGLMQAGHVHEIRAREICLEPQGNSPITTSPLFRWLAADTEWHVYVGPSTVSQAGINVLAEPTRCYPLVPSAFALCHDEGLRQLVSVVRADTPTGWTQELWLRCLGANAPLPGEVPASPPSVLELWSTRAYEMSVRYIESAMLSYCECARPEVQLSLDADTWFVPPSDCHTLGAIECSLEAQPDTEYYGRIRIRCADDSLSSNFTSLAAPVATAPLCKWRVDSGRPGMLQCNDATFCDASDDSCCVGRGGRMRCPPEQPVMCQAKVGPQACAGGTDRCCRTSCALNGVDRACNEEHWPAKTPIFVSMASVGAANLQIEWEAQDNLIGRTGCRFDRWDVQLAVYPTFDWVHFSVCDHRRERGSTECLIEDLQSLTKYRARIVEACSEPSINSVPLFTSEVLTRPWPATAPASLECHDEAFNSMRVTWQPGSARDCAFVRWQVMIAPESDPTNFRTHNCQVQPSRSAPSCLLQSLTSDSVHLVQMREVCADPLATGAFPATPLACRTVARPAAPPQNLRAEQVEKYTLVFGWQLSSQYDCQFEGFEAQVQANGTDWPQSVASTDAADWTNAEYRCFSKDLNPSGGPSCKISVGVASGMLYNARVRYVCAQPDTNSEWAYLAPTWGDMFTTLPADRADVPFNLSFAFLSPVSLGATWNTGVLAGDCVFVRWELHVRPEGADDDAWVLQPHCTGSDRDDTSCFLDTRELAAGPHDVRLREACTDVLAWSPSLQRGYADANDTFSLRTLPESARPANIRLDDVGWDWMHLGWDSAASSDACSRWSWQTEWRYHDRRDGTDAWFLEGAAPCSGTDGAPGISRMCPLGYGLGWEGSTKIQVRVFAACAEPQSVPLMGMPPYLFWTSPGEFTARVPPSLFNNARTGTLDPLPTAEENGGAVVVDPEFVAWRCVLQYDFAGDFTVCAAPDKGYRHLRVSRILPYSGLSIRTGWEDDFPMHCIAKSQEGHAEFRDVQSAQPAHFALLADKDSTTVINADYRSSEFTGTCHCAKNDVQLRAIDHPDSRQRQVNEWFSVTGTCTEHFRRRCDMQGLTPDTLYAGRFRLACENEAASSPFIYAAIPIGTHPICVWMQDSGRPGELQCADGAFCPMVNATCCELHGGRMRCPPEAPMMCGNARDCADGTDRCCSADCLGHGGPRPCGNEDLVSAKPPADVVARPEKPASLKVTWRTGEFVSGRDKNCRFLRWAMELKQTADCTTTTTTTTTTSTSTTSRTTTSTTTTTDPNATLTSATNATNATTTTWMWTNTTTTTTVTEEPWINPCLWRAPDFGTCTTLNDRRVLSCEVEGLRTVMNYALRMKEVCTDTLLDSAWSEAPLIDLTLPFGALEPEQVRCHNRTYESMVARWLPGDGRDCIFDAWEVQLRLMPRGEEGAPGPWVPGCVVRDREDASCSLQGLLSDRDYQVQVRELCADPSANSPFSLHDGACITEELAAEAPYNVTVRDATVNPTTFQVSWTGADPRACVFAGWELQAVEQSRDWPPEWTSTTSTTTTTTTSTSSRTMTTTTTTADPNGTANGTVNETLLFAVGGSLRRLESGPIDCSMDDVADTSRRARRAWRRRLQEEAGDLSLAPVRSLADDGWRLRAADSDFVTPAARWDDEIYGCFVQDRGDTQCEVQPGAGSGVTYKVRVRETCAERHHNSLWGYLDTYNITTPLPVPAEAPLSFVVTLPRPHYLTFQWQPGAPGQCMFTHWRLELVQVTTTSSTTTSTGTTTTMTSTSSTTSSTTTLFSQCQWETLATTGVDHPSGRAGHVAVMQQDGSMLIFAGATFWLNDAWQLTPTGPDTARWDQVYAAADAPSSRDRFVAGALSDGSTVIWGGRCPGSRPECFVAPVTDSVWRVTVAPGVLNPTLMQGTWQELISTGGPTPRWYHTAVVLPDDRMIIYGGVDSSSIKWDTWQVEVDPGSGTAQWTQVTTTGGPPPARFSHGSVLLPDGRMVIMAGQTATAKRNDVWQLTFGEHRLSASGIWTEVWTAKGPPPARSDFTASLLDSDGRIVVYGGYSDDEYRATDAWTLKFYYDGSARAEWDLLTDCAGPPLAHHSAVMMANNRMLVFGGEDDIGTGLDKSYVLSVEVWTTTTRTIVLTETTTTFTSTTSTSTNTQSVTSTTSTTSTKSTRTSSTTTTLTTSTTSTSTTATRAGWVCDQLPRYMPDGSPPTCTVDATSVAPDHSYHMAITENCEDPNSNSETKVFWDAFFLPTVEGEKTRVELLTLGETWIDVRTTPGDGWYQLPDGSGGTAVCGRQAWQVEYIRRDWYAAEPPDITDNRWTAVPGCEGLGGLDVHRCNITGLTKNTPYYVRLTEACSTPVVTATMQALSQWPINTRPGIWLAYAGGSPTPQLEANVGGAPGHCEVVKECCDDQYAICYSGFENSIVTISRTDNPSGWGQDLRLRCWASSLLYLHPGLVTPQRASPGTGLTFAHAQEFQDPAFIAALSFKETVPGSCLCATPRFQLLPENSNTWLTVDGQCTLPFGQQALAPGGKCDVLAAGGQAIAGPGNANPAMRLGHGGYV